MSPFWEQLLSRRDPSLDIPRQSLCLELYIVIEPSGRLEILIIVVARASGDPKDQMRVVFVRDEMPDKAGHCSESLVSGLKVTGSPAVASP